MKRFLTAGILAALITTPVFAQQDAPPVDVSQLLQALKTMREQQAQQAKAGRQQAIQHVANAASSPSAAASAWEEAVRQTQFEGAPKEGAAFREWKEKEGDALNDQHAQNAARLYFAWLQITLQRSGGVPVKDILSQVVGYTKEVTAAQMAMEAFEDKMKREKELDAGGKRGARRPNNDDQVKRMHEQILKTSVADGPPSKALKLDEFLSTQNFGGAEAKEGRDARNAAGWEMVPGNTEGIFQKIILPELRASKDPRLLEYWDMKIKREGEAAAKAKLAFEAERFTQVRRPELLWNRAKEEILLGHRNKAINEMFTLIKNYPAHPQADDWIQQLEGVLLPPTPAPAAAGAPAPAGAGTPAR